MGAPFLVERGIDPSEEELGPALMMRLLLERAGVNLSIGLREVLILCSLPESRNGLSIITLKNADIADR